MDPAVYQQRKVPVSRPVNKTSAGLYTWILWVKHSLAGGFTYLYFHLYLRKWSNITNIFQMGWNHQLDIESINFDILYLPNNWKGPLNPPFIHWFVVRLAFCQVQAIKDAKQVTSSFLGVWGSWDPNWIFKTRWWQLKYFFSPRSSGKWSNLRSIFFKWVVQPPTSKWFSHRQGYHMWKAYLASCFFLNTKGLRYPLSVARIPVSNGKKRWGISAPKSCHDSGGSLAGISTSTASRWPPCPVKK